MPELLREDVFEPRYGIVQTEDHLVVGGDFAGKRLIFDVGAVKYSPILGQRVKV